MLLLLLYRALVLLLDVSGWFKIVIDVAQTLEQLVCGFKT
jgi:hypothetical protein